MASAGPKKRVKSTAKVGLGVLRLLGTETAQPSLWMGRELPPSRQFLVSFDLLCYCHLAPCVVNGAS